MLGYGSFFSLLFSRNSNNFISYTGDHIHELTAHKSNVHAVVFSCHNILATGGWDKQIFLWNPYTADILFTLSGWFLQIHVSVYHMATS